MDAMEVSTLAKVGRGVVPGSKRELLIAEDRGEGWKIREHHASQSQSFGL